MITQTLVDLDVPPLNDLQNAGHIQFRGMLVNDHQLWTVNGVDSMTDTFIGIFTCDPDRDEWILEDYFAVKCLYRECSSDLWINCCLQYVVSQHNTIAGLKHPYGLGMYNKYGWLVISSQKDNSIVILDGGGHLVHSITPNITAKIGFRGLAVCSDLDLIFVASPDSNNILVFDIANGFRNTFSIELPNSNTEPISVLLNQKVLYVSDRANDKGLL